MSLHRILGLVFFAAAVVCRADALVAGETFTVSSAAELKALGTLKAGTTVIWKGGLFAAETVDIRGAGTAEEPVVVRAQNPGKTIFTRNSQLSISGSYIIVEGFHWLNPDPEDVKAVVTFTRKSDNCTLRDCAITGDNTAEDAQRDSKWVSLYGQNNTVTGCTFRDKRNIGTLMVVWLEADVVPRHTIAGNSFTRPVTLRDENGKPMNGQETIRIGTSTVSMQEAACTVEDNYFYHCHGEQAEIVSNKSCGNIYRRNLFVESQGSLTLRHGNDCVVSGNYFIGNGMEGTGGVRIIGERHTVEYNWFENLAGTGYRAAICLVKGQENPKLSGYWQVKDAKVTNNVIVECKYGISANYASKSSNQVMPVISTVIANNTVSAQSSSKYAVYVLDNPKIEWNNNRVYGRVSGVSIRTEGSSPVKPQMISGVKPAWEAIRNNAGCGWIK